MSTEVPDGATQRHSRMLELLTFINLRDGATTTQIQSHMLTAFGLKFKTTSEMIHELALAGAIKEDGHGFWRLTEKQQVAFKRLVASEEDENTGKLVLKKIDGVKDKKRRDRLMKLYQKFLDVLSEEESTGE